jgi:hypothetical protein
MISEQAKKCGKQKKPAPIQSAFKTLLVRFLEANADMLKLPSKYHCPIKCSVKESSPNFLLTDGVFFISGYFTPEALQKHEATGGIPVANLQGFLIDLNKWSLELIVDQNNKTFTSYAGLELRLIIHDFKVVSSTKMLLENKNPINLFRDDQSRAYIQNFLYQQQQLILQDKLEKGDIKFSDFTTDISVKGNSKNVYLDSATEIKHFTDYQFLKRTKSEIAKPAVEDSLKKNLKKKVDAANLQTEADLKILGDKAISGEK